MTDNFSANSFVALVVDKANADDEQQNGQHDDLHNAHTDAGTDAGLAEEGENPAAQGDATPVTPSDSVMPHDARRVLVHLMRQGTIMAAQKPHLFVLLCRYEADIRKHLSEVYLQLVLDQKMGVAFIASATYEEEKGRNDSALEADSDGDSEALDDAGAAASATLIPKRTLSLFDTLLLLVLRKHYQDRESAGEQKITIDIERLESYLTPFLPITDHASKDRKKLSARVKEMVKRKILSTIRGAEERYEITPIIRYVVSARFLESMLTEYTRLAQLAQQADAPAEQTPPLDDSDNGDNGDNSDNSPKASGVNDE